MGFEPRKLGLRIWAPHQDSSVGLLSCEARPIGAEKNGAVSIVIGSEKLVGLPSLPRGETKGRLGDSAP